MINVWKSKYFLYQRWDKYVPVTTGFRMGAAQIETDTLSSGASHKLRRAVRVVLQHQRADVGVFHI